MNDGTLVTREEKVSSRNVGGAGFVVHPICRPSCRFSRDNLTLSSHSSPPPSAPKNPSMSSTATHKGQQLLNPKLDAFYEELEK
ncbi:hypothetical protein RB195_013528 [Necator americanus]|uniref:Uncharacterized protein n=1 Tax=Necator americanus TaxID=51031 RepID=A0ABR1DW37_NECAM